MRKLTNIILVLLLIAGVTILYYPSLSNYVLMLNIVEGNSSYLTYYGSLSDEEKAEQLNKAKEYNQALLEMNEREGLEESVDILKQYNDILNFEGIIGYLHVPKINVYLPIAHGTAYDILENNVGHIQRTAFPVGGEGTHCVLTGHSGLVTAEILTDLDQLELGDEIYLDVLDKRRVYKVEKIEVIEPSDTDRLVPYEGKDYVSLITCTPYGVNSHRLVVRTEFVREEPIDTTVNTAASVIENPLYQYFAVMLGVILVWILFNLLMKKLFNRTSKKKSSSENSDNDGSHFTQNND